MQKINLKEFNLGIVTPVGAEGDNLKDFIDQVLKNCENYFKKINFFLITDNVTSKIAHNIIDDLTIKDKRVIKIWSPENRNVVEAYKKGYSKALINSDFILEIDAGFSHDPYQIPLFINEMKLNLDCVLGVRFGMKKSNYSGNIKRFFLSYGGTLLINFLLGTKIPDMTSGFSLYSKNCLTAILKNGINSKSPFFQSEMRYYVKNKNYCLIPISYKSPSFNISFFSILDSIFNLYKLFIKRILNK